jgi:hypothetical protein
LGNLSLAQNTNKHPLTKALKAFSSTKQLILLTPSLKIILAFIFFFISYAE